MTEAPNEEEQGGSKPRSDAANRLAARRAAKAAAKAAKKGTAPVVPGSVTKQVQAARSFYDENGRLLIGGVLAVVLVAILAIVISRQIDDKAGTAAAQLHLGVQSANGIVLGPDEEAPEETAVPSFESASARAEKALAEFERTAKTHAGTAAARWALVGQGNALRVLGKHGEAEKRYQQVIADEDSAPFLRARATEGLGFALEAEQKYDAALERFKQLGELQQGAHKPLADYHRARMYMAQGEKQKAAEVLEALVKAERARPAEEATRYESVVTDAEMLLTELSVELNAPKLRADIPSAGGGRAQEGGGGITQDIVEALRKQLESGEGGGNGVSKEVIDALEQQVNAGGSSSTTVTIPAPKPAGEQASPAGEGTAAEPE